MGTLSQSEIKFSTFITGGTTVSRYSEEQPAWHVKYMKVFVKVGLGFILKFYLHIPWGYELRCIRNQNSSVASVISNFFSITD
jgi:hypothetical protein